MLIDTSFDFRSDTPAGKDPDSHSPTLRRYHKLLWSKPLPGGVCFELNDTTPRVYLHHRSDLGEFWLGSDGMVPTFRYMTRLIDQISKYELETFLRIGWTIGDFIVFPGNRVKGKMTINGARGWHPRIRDRFDLTVECIRRHYLGEQNPLGKTLTLHRDFFGLFDDFAGYVEFFLLQDLVDESASSVKFFMPFDNFTMPPRPETPKE
jgi:hypothetical protein